VGYLPATLPGSWTAKGVLNGQNLVQGNFTISPGSPLQISGPASLSSGTVGTAYTPVAFTATGGTGTGYMWSATGLPSGMSFSSAGVLSGTPGSSGNFNPQFKVTDSGSNTATKILSLTIGAPTLQIQPAFDIVDVHKSAPTTAFRPVLLLQTNLALANQWASK